MDLRRIASRVASRVASNWHEDAHRVATREDWITEDLYDAYVVLPEGTDAASWYQKNQNLFRESWVKDVKGSPKGKNVLHVVVNVDEVNQDIQYEWDGSPLAPLFELADSGAIPGEVYEHDTSF